MVWVEIWILLYEFFSLCLRVCSKAVEPDVVLSEADVDIISCVFRRSLDESLKYGGGTNQASLVVRIGYEMISDSLFIPTRRYLRNKGITG